jgi:hypothetical protein
MFPLTIKLAGVQFGACQDNIKKFAGPGVGDFELVREPDNPADQNAIRVALFGHFELGYVPRPIAKELAPLMDNGRYFVAEYVSRNEHPKYDLIGLTVMIKEESITEQVNG